MDFFGLLWIQIQILNTHNAGYFLTTPPICNAVFNDKDG